MKTRQVLLVLTLAIVLARATNAADYTIKAGSTSRSIYVQLLDVPTSAKYVRAQGTVNSFLSTELTNVDSTWSSGKWKAVDFNGWGALVRIDLPDAALAAGVPSVSILVSDTTGEHHHVTIDLVGYDPTAAALAANVTQFGGTNGTFSGGRPEVNVKLVEGVDATDAIATPGLLLNEAIVGTTPEENNLWQFASNAANLGVRAGHMAIVYDASAGNRPSVHYVTNVSGVNVTVDRVPDFGATEGDMVKIFATPGQLKEILEDTGTTLDDLLDTEINAIKTKTDFLPSATAGTNGGLPTVNGSNYVAGVQGTLNTLDALDTAQDAQHATTQGRLPAALVSGRMDASVGAMAGNVITAAVISDGALGADEFAADALTAAKFAADVATEFQAGLATAAALDAVDNFVDTEVADIKTKTDFLPSATAGSAGGVFIAGTNATASITGGLTANITGNLSGSVGSVTGNVGGNVVGSVGSISGITFPANFSGLTITSGRVNADVTHWIGNPAATPTVAGVPEVDITHVLGSPVCQ